MRTSITSRVVGLALGLSFLGWAVFGQTEHRDIRVNIEKYKLASALYKTALEYFAEQDYARARTKIEECLEKIPEHSEAHLLMAKTYYAQGSYAEALDSMEKAMESWEATATLVERHREQVDAERRNTRDELSSSISELRGQLSRATSQQQRVLIEGQIAQAQGTIDEIDRRLLESLERGDQVPAEYWFFHGNVLLRLKRYNEAAVHYLEALGLDPGHTGAANNLASLLLEAQQCGKALDVIEQAEANGAAINPELKQAILAGLQP